MSVQSRMGLTGLLGVALVAVLSPVALAAGHGSSHGGGSGGSSGWSGGSSGGHSNWSGSGAGSHADFQSHGNSPHTSGFNGGPNASHANSWNHDWSGPHGDWSGHHGDWSGYHGGWDHEHEWWHDHGHNWVGWWGIGIGFGWPWYGVGWWPGYYDYPYGAPYYGVGYPAYAYEAVPYTAAYPPSDTATAPPETNPLVNNDSMEFYPQALAAFQQGDYRNATRLAGHASIDDPRSQSVHLLLLLGLFAIGEYRGAAMEAHAVASLGKTPDWATLYAFYGNVNSYTEHLRALEKFVHKNTSAPEGRFLLGCQYLMEGHKDAAKNELLEALKLTPKDRLAAQLLTQAGGTVPPEIAAQQQVQPPAPPAPHATK